MWSLQDCLNISPASLTSISSLSVEWRKVSPTASYHFHKSLSLFPFTADSHQHGFFRFTSLQESDCHPEKIKVFIRTRPDSLLYIITLTWIIKSHSWWKSWIIFSEQHLFFMWESQADILYILFIFMLLLMLYVLSPWAVYKEQYTYLT